MRCCASAISAVPRGRESVHGAKRRNGFSFRTAVSALSIMRLSTQYLDVTHRLTGETSGRPLTNPSKYDWVEHESIAQHVASALVCRLSRNQ
jgi:hypothetical protein